jgi:hypothetical protein
MLLIIRVLAILIQVVKVTLTLAFYLLEMLCCKLFIFAVHVETHALRDCKVKTVDVIFILLSFKSLEFMEDLLNFAIRVISDVEEARFILRRVKFLYDNESLAIKLLGLRLSCMQKC